MFEIARPLDCSKEGTKEEKEKIENIVVIVVFFMFPV